jgi:AraC-like DNA-binding protein
MILDLDVYGGDLYAFAVETELSEGLGDWEAPGYHCLLFAERGVLHFTGDRERWFVPPRRAALLSSDLRCRLECLRPVQLRAIFLASSWWPGLSGDRADLCVFAVEPLAREMIRYSVRWGPDRREDASNGREHGEDEHLASSFFETLALFVEQWCREEVPCRLPRGGSDELVDAMDYALEDLGAASLEEAARRAGVSVRTMSRRFRREARMNWRTFLYTARMRRAIELLDDGSETAIADIAHAVGFSSPSAFSQAFTRFAGEPPSVFRSNGE